MVNAPAWSFPFGRTPKQVKTDKKAKKRKKWPNLTKKHQKNVKNGKKSLKFMILTAFSAFLVAGSAAFFSIFGLSKLFSGAFFAIVIMASSLELAKIVSASFLYRYWGQISKVMQIYMTTGVIVLVLVTSAGIFGFLSNAYQSAALKFEKENTKLVLFEEEMGMLKEDKALLLREMEEQVKSFPSNYVTAKRKTREEYLRQVYDINYDIRELTPEIANLKINMVETGVDIGPAIYIARAFGTDIDTVVKFFILILIFVFDPMAVSLVIATNVILKEEDYGRHTKMELSEGENDQKG